MSLTLDDEVAALPMEEADALVERFRADFENLADAPHGRLVDEQLEDHVVLVRRALTQAGFLRDAEQALAEASAVRCAWTSIGVGSPQKVRMQTSP